MPDSVRKRIVDAVTTRFQSILVSGGYETNLGSNLSVWRDAANNPFQEHELPAANLRDFRNETQPSSALIHNHTLSFWVEIVVSMSATNAQTLRKAIADIHKAVGVDRLWYVSATKLAQDTQIVKDESETEHGEIIVGGARMLMEIKYRTASFDPYTLR